MIKNPGVILFCAVMSFSGVVHAQGKVVTNKYEMADYVKSLLRVSCERRLDKKDEETFINDATQGASKKSTVYGIVHDTIVIGGAIGKKLKEEGFFNVKNNLRIDSCNAAAEYVKAEFELTPYFTDKILTGRPGGLNVDSGSKNFKTSADDLFEMYDENEVAADDKIGKRPVEVTGVVQSIDKNFTDTVIVKLQTSNQFMSVRLTMEDTERSKAAKLRKKQTITIICERMALVMGSPVGSACRFK